MGDELTISEVARLGGQAGTGKAKVRGNSEHYSKLAKLPRKKRRGDNRAGNAKNRRNRTRRLDGERNKQILGKQNLG